MDAVMRRGFRASDSRSCGFVQAERRDDVFAQQIRVRFVACLGQSFAEQPVAAGRVPGAFLSEQSTIRLV
jgi:hypothetical protein